ncbi:MAG: hypothetical protein ABUT39_06615 [Acidobacteriota bacterium]
MQAGPVRPIEPGSAVPSDRQPGGLKGWALFAIGAFGLGINHVQAVSSGKVSIWLLLLGPLLVLLGVGAAYDVRILTAATKHAKSVPGRFRVIATLLSLAAMGISAWLALGFYRIF